MHDPDPQTPSAWRRALDDGIDVSLLEENLRLTPDERLAQLVAMQRLFDAIHPDREAPPRDPRWTTGTAGLPAVTVSGNTGSRWASSDAVVTCS